MKWEDICSRCGLCCHEKTVYPDAIEIDLSSPCQYFDENTKLCKVYKDRFTYCSRCEKVTPAMAAFDTSLPETCSYIEWARRHHIRFRKRREMIISE